MSVLYQPKYLKLKGWSLHIWTKYKGEVADVLDSIQITSSNPKSSYQNYRYIYKESTKKLARDEYSLDISHSNCRILGMIRLLLVFTYILYPFIYLFTD